MTNFYALKDGNYWEGEDISSLVSQFVEIRFESRKIYYKVKGFKERGAHSYSADYTKEEMLKDAYKTIFLGLKNFGYKTARRL